MKLILLFFVFCFVNFYSFAEDHCNSTKNKHFQKATTATTKIQKNFNSRPEHLIIQKLSFLPPWCPPDTFFIKNTEHDIVDIIPPETSETVTAHDSYRIERTRNKEGFITCITLTNITKNILEGRIIASWQKGSSSNLLTSVSVENSSSTTLLSHFFSYDSSDRVSSHTIEGNLSGNGEKSSYETTFVFDKQGHIIEEHEQNGKSSLYFYPKTEKDFFVVIESDKNQAIRLRAASKTNTITGDFEEIVDNGSSSSIKDLSDVTWRKFKRASIQKDKEIVTIGVFDVASKKEIVLRKTITSRVPEKRESNIYDAADALVSSSAITTQELVDIQSHSTNDWHSFIDGLGRLRTIQKDSSTIFSQTERSYDMCGNVSSKVSTSENPTSISYTVRNQPCELIFPDGSKEIILYSLDGQKISHTYRNGKKETFSRDSFHRLLSHECLEEGAISPITTTYIYKDLNCMGWNVSDGKFCHITRDLFDRITGIDLPLGFSYTISYDPLDRMTHVETTGKEPWIWQKTYSLNGLETETKILVQTEKFPFISYEKRRPNGSLSERREEAKKEVFFMKYDDQGRVIAVDHEKDGVRHISLRKVYSLISESDSSLQRESTTFSDNTTLVEESSQEGKRRSRIWFDASGSEVLREDFSPIDAKGSMRLTQKTHGYTNNQRTVEWIFGPNKRLSSISIGTNTSQYVYDDQGRLIHMHAPKRDIYYSWEGPCLTRLSSGDETIDYRFSYDDKGRMNKLVDTINSKTVVRSFDEENHLTLDGEEERTISLLWDKEGSLSSILLPDNSRISYEKRKTSFIVTRNDFSSEKPLFSQKDEKNTPPHCCRKTSQTHQDALGAWKEDLSYDSLNQLKGEKGEFCEDYSFTPFGSLESKDGILSSHTANNEAENYGKELLFYDEEGNILSRTRDGFKKEYFYDALGRLLSVKNSSGIEETFRYDALDRIQEISIFKKGELLSTKKLLWIGDHELGSFSSELKIPDPLFTTCVAIEKNSKIFDVETNAQGSITTLSLKNTPIEIYRYSAFGSIHAYDTNGEEIEPTSSWLYCGKRFFKEASCYDFGHRRYDPFLMRWFEKDPLGMVDGVDDRMYSRNNPSLFLDASGLFSFPIDWTSIKEGLSDAFNHISSSTWKSLTFAKSQLDWFVDIRDEFEQIAFQMIGQKWTQLIGYNRDISTEGTYGTQEKQPKVRVTFINGILNWSNETVSSAALISKTHGDVPVHYIYVATDGFTGDVIRGALSRAGIFTQQSQLLAHMWRRLLKEMKDPNGTIIHYAHSLGATDTYNALQLLTPQERNAIRVTTFGGATLIGEGLCGKSDNYVSENDAVPIIDLWHYIRGSLGKIANVHFLPSEGSPLVDHLFGGKTYRTVLELLGQKFQEEYLFLYADTNDQP